MEEGQSAISIVASFTAVGGFLGAAFALFTGRPDAAAEWLVRGTVGGGIYGVIEALSGLH